ncbi:MAG: helix-turn-helix domain-containing protein [Thermoleophilia bacterium]
MADYIERGPALGNAVWMRRDRELGLSRDDLARRLGWGHTTQGGRDRSGWAPSTIVRLERGQRPVYSEVEFQHLARALELTGPQLKGRISQASATPRAGEALALPDLIDRIPDDDARALMETVADALAGIARRLGDNP